MFDISTFLAVEYAEKDFGYINLELWIEDVNHKHQVNGWCAHKDIVISPGSDINTVYIVLRYIMLPQDVFLNDVPLFLEFLKRRGFRLGDIQMLPEEHAEFGSDNECKIVVRKEELKRWFDLAQLYDKGHHEERDGETFGLYVTKRDNESHCAWESMPYLNIFGSRMDRARVYFDVVCEYLANLSRRETEALATRIWDHESARERDTCSVGKKP